MPAVLSASTANMQSLLSQSESNAFQSFLSSIDYAEDAITPNEWAALSAPSGSVDPSYSDDIDSVQNPEGRQALAKATKDLMSLNTDGNWDGPNNLNHSPVIHPHFDGHETQTIEQYDQQQSHRYQQESHGVNSYSSRHDSFPFLHTKSQNSSQPMRFPMQLQHHPVPPLTRGSPDQRQQRSSISPPSPYGFSQQQQLHQVHMPQRSRDTSEGTKPKRSHTLPSTSPSFARPSSDPPHKRQRLSLSEGQSSTPATTSVGFPSTNHSSSSPQSKQNLLSPSQKKANHIQSEQKRRANIRKGYAALCETIPALREAIREEEEAERIAAARPNTTPIVDGVGIVDGDKMNGAGKKKRSKRGTGVNGKDLDDKDKDRADGRAGPRSENMVLSKTIEHIQYLRTERSSLLARLQRARASLPPGHPALTPLNPDPPWEREWKGGEGKLNEGDGDGDEEGDGGSGDEED